MGCCLFVCIGDNGGIGKLFVFAGVITSGLWGLSSGVGLVMRERNLVCLDGLVRERKEGVVRVGLSCEKIHSIIHTSSEWRHT